jgi:hypothetical protein
MPTAAATDSGTDRNPRTLARATDGRAPVDLAARDHRIHASDPVTKRLGPTSNPTSST